MKYKKISEINEKYGTYFDKINGCLNGLNYIKYLLIVKSIPTNKICKTLLQVNKTTKKETFIKLNN
tara:strand:- start:1431 stop:1628 length:198 start_codon:yes stop_codon:yes gene_type:complete